MNKIASFILIFTTLFFLGVSTAFAVDLTITKIGTVSTTGVDYSVVNYTGGIPVLEGTATPGASVTVKINTVSASTLAASPSGIWQFVPTSLDTGANNVLVSSGTTNLSFVLNFNVSITPTATPSARIVEILPESGIWENIVLVVLVGITVTFLGKYLRESMLEWEGKKK